MTWVQSPAVALNVGKEILVRDLVIVLKSKKLSLIGPWSKNICNPSPESVCRRSEAVKLLEAHTDLQPLTFDL